MDGLRPWLALLLLACGSEAQPARPDASRPDAARLADAAARIDSSRRMDAGRPADASLRDAPLERDAASPDAAGECPSGMFAVRQPDLAPFCMDAYEAPNRPGDLPLVMYTFTESEAWCAARGKRLCFDDEWTRVCAGTAGTAYPYGATREPGRCNDDRTWRVYTQSLLNGWPARASSPEVETLEQLWTEASAVGAAASSAVEHVQSLYQGTRAGERPGCTSDLGGFDTVGNVEEWTRRRDGGTTSFHGKLKGRYWAEARTCQGGVTTHGDAFRFYEIGFRCCRDL